MSRPDHCAAECRPAPRPGPDGARETRPLRVLVLPPIEWLPARRDHRPDAGPDPGVLERGLAALGITVTILDPMRRPWNPLHGRHPVLQGIDPIRALRVLLLWRRVDAVVCVFEGPALLPVLLRRLARFRPRLLMWDLGLAEGWRLRDRILDLLIPRLDRILVLGSNQPPAIAARWPRHAPVRWIGHYTDTAFWRPMPSPEPATEPYVLSVGDDAGRDFDLLLELGAGLDRALVVRSGRALALDPHRHRHVRHLRSRIDYRALRDLYAGAAVVVVPLRDMPTAGGVTAVLEAAAMGLPMVVSDSPGVRDWLRDGETCLVVACGDAAAMQSAVRRLLADAALRHRLGAAARAFAEQCCSPEVFASRLAVQLRAGPGA